ncbi:hypothetical protein GCM10027040_31150 [Halomonas shantousis]
MRLMLGSLGGAFLALVLFYLLALLVAPPEDTRQEIVVPLSISMVEAPQQQAPEPAAAPAEAMPAPPVEAPPPPPPAPMPAIQTDSPIALPEPETPPLETPEVSLDAQLPELAVEQPQPSPKPQPSPEPRPTPEPASEPVPAPEPVANAAPQAPVAAPSEVESSPQPTVRVPPQYPSRAQRRGLEGYVEVRFTIQPNGRVDPDSLRVVDAQPRHVFERAALKAIAEWQFPEASAPREARQRLEFQLRG